MANGPHSGYQTEEGKPDVQQRFGYTVWIWTIGSALLIAVLIVLLLLSLFGYFSDPNVAPPV